jgi:hypothetical protein
MLSATLIIVFQQATKSLLALNLSRPVRMLKLRFDNLVAQPLVWVTDSRVVSSIHRRRVIPPNPESAGATLAEAELFKRQRRIINKSRAN